jgi:DNA-3-methyladenine glycosylase II
MDTLQLALEYLSRDPVMKGLIEKLPAPEMGEEAVDPAADVIETIVCQQLSDKAGATIFGRLEELLNKEGVGFEPEKMLLIQDQKIRNCGVSFAKVKCIKSFCEQIVSGQLKLDQLSFLSDEEVINELTTVWGIGRWTAEMILMFTLRRPDVFSVGDLGLRTAVSQLYFVERSDLIKIEEISRQWSPYRSIASRYLWKSLED